MPEICWYQPLNCSEYVCANSYKVLGVVPDFDMPSVNLSHYH